MSKDISELLTEEEVDFVRKVFLNPNCKLHNVFSQEGTPLWKNPEMLGIIKCTGSYKWVAANLEMKLITQV